LAYSKKAKVRAAAPVMIRVPTGAKWEAMAALDGEVLAPVLVEEALCEFLALLPPVVLGAELPEAGVDLWEHSLELRDLARRKLLRLTQNR
jgi:hypothetical protein